ncbi:zinc finger MYND domain-containing protein 15-like [Saccostrea echinata]|uniref:zinc finger MYND domain-containing protein 15-like n=1 Tax=Saccostrea echinata TaxID=191078 RepID=UPI002A831368|nr:zinc finger MYND domain-containing protein 15-like [Saccostrea echinata]
MENSEEETVKNIPSEDTVWFIERCLGDGNDYLQVIDKHCKLIGKCQQNVTRDLPSDILQCFMKACLFPCKTPVRRPRHLVLRSETIEKFTKSPYLEQKFHHLGINLVGSTKTVSLEGIKWRECHFCHMRADQQLLFLCPMCQAVFYCSTECQSQHLQGSSSQSHSFWCSKFHSYMKDKKIAEFPFEFSKETCSSDFDEMQYREFLQNKGVFGEGCWLREGLNPADEVQRYSYGKCMDLDNPYVLPVESCVLDEPVCVDSQSAVVDWSSYYRCRGLDLSSPIALLLQWPLTVFYIIKYLLNIQNAVNPSDGQINIDIVGVEKEVELIPVFKELGYLLSDHVISIHMFGKHLHHRVKEKSWIFSNVTITVHNQFYHKHVSQERIPNVVIGLNAGLAAYSSWIPTINKLKEMKIPAYFTDYCRSSIEFSKLMLQDHCGINISAPILNPFRSPIRKISSDHELPWFSNAFIYCLEYNSG